MSQDPNAPQQPGHPDDVGRGYPPVPDAQQGYPSAPGSEPAGYQPAGYQPAGYPGGGQPYPGQDVAGSGPLTPPPPVATAVKLMYVGAVLSLVSVVTSFLFTDTVRETLADQPGLDPAAIDLAVTVGLVLGAVFGLIGVGLWILNAVFNARGKKWARILSTVLAGLSAVSFLAGLTQPAPGLARLLGVVQLFLAVAIVVLLWRPESSRFYEAASAPRY